MVDTWDPRRLYRFIDHLERHLLKRELTDEEYQLCLQTFYSSEVGIKKTIQRMRRVLAKQLGYQVKIFGD